MKQTFKNLFSHTGSDLLASVVVFLVALPLCLGIALASGVPLFSGIISGIVGGIVIGMASKSPLSVSGPAAGLVIIVLNAVEELSSFESFLLATCIAGFIQLILGFAKAGVIGLYFPSSVIKGMLAAIGLILILKQIPHLVGFDADAFGEMEFFQRDGSNTLLTLWNTVENSELGATLIGGISLIFLIVWGLPLVQKHPFLRRIPGGVIVVFLAVGLNYLLSALDHGLFLGPPHLVSLPIFSNFTSFQNALIYPSFEDIAEPRLYITAVTIAIVASLETLLSVEAIERLDPEKRHTPKNQELKAQGIGNIIAGFFGGLPITAVIVRSSTNLDSGAKTKMSTIYHGILLVAAVAIVPGIMNRIPLSALAAILIVVGYKLTKPSLYRQQFKIGRAQFIPFIVTVVAILFTDLLIGILIGMGVGAFYILRSNYKVAYHYEEHDNDSGSKDISIVLSEHVSFLNKANLQNILDRIPNNSKVLIDGTRAKFIDYDAVELIQDYQTTAEEREIELEVRDVHRKKR